MLTLTGRDKALYDLVYGNGSNEFPHTFAHYALVDTGEQGEHYKRSVVKALKESVAVSDKAEDLARAKRGLEHALNEFEDKRKAGLNDNEQGEQGEQGSEQGDQGQQGNGGNGIGESASSDQNDYTSDEKVKAALEALERAKQALDKTIKKSTRQRHEFNTQQLDSETAMQTVRLCNKIGFNASSYIIRLMGAIPSMPSSCGTGAKRLLIRNQSGATPHECIMPRALGRKSRTLKKAQIAGGRQVKDKKHAKVKLNLVIDTSGSMQNSFSSTRFSFLEVAKGIAIAWFLEMTQAEKDSLTCYVYDRNCTKLNSFSQIQYLRPAGGTDISSLIPHIKKASSTDRWLVITDGEIPSLVDFDKAAKLAIISLCLDNEDDRVIRYTNDNNSQRMLIRRLKDLLK